MEDSKLGAVFLIEATEIVFPKFHGQQQKCYILIATVI